MQEVNPHFSYGSYSVFSLIRDSFIPMLKAKEATGWLINLFNENSLVVQRDYTEVRTTSLHHCQGELCVHKDCKPTAVDEARKTELY